MSKEKDWSKMAKNFDELQDYIVGEETSFIISKELAKLHRLGNVLELGCGNGKYTRQIIHASKNITATDFAPEMVDAAKEKLEDLENLHIEKADCYKLKYEDNSFDTVFMANLIHVVLEPEEALAEAKRVLKKDGKLILLSFTPDGMTLENIENMKRKYLEVFGSFPDKKVPMMLKDLVSMVEAKEMAVNKAELIGSDTKAMFVIAAH